MKILFVIENYIPHFGGAEIVFKNLSEGLVKAGHDVTLVTHRLPNTPKYEVMNGVKVHRVSCFDSRYLFTFFAVPKVIKLARDADIIQTTTFNGAPTAWLAGKLTKTPVAVTIHEVWIDKWQQYTNLGKIGAFIHNILEKMIHALNYDAYTPVSDSTKQQLLDIKVPENKIHRIHNGMDYERWDKNNFDNTLLKNKFNLHNSWNIFMAGRLGTAKGHEFMLMAMPKILEKIPNTKLVYNHSMKSQYKSRHNYIMKLIKDLKIENNVVLTEGIPYEELGSYMIGADCVVVPSLAEGFGYAVLQACELGTPVVASNTTSIPEVIWGKHVLVEPRNPNAIAEGVCKVYDGEYTTTPKKTFSWNTNIQSHIHLYEKLINKV